MAPSTETRTYNEDSKFSDVNGIIAVNTRNINETTDPIPIVLVNAAGNIVQATRLRQGFLGSAGTGSDGNTDRVYTISTTRNITIQEVYLDGVLLTEDTHYTDDDSAKTITILIAVWDSQNISIFYNVENLLSRDREEFDGSDGTGSDGDTDRVYTLTTTSVVEIVEVYIDGILLTETTNYTVDNSAKTITMVSQAVFNSQRVSVFYNA